MARYVADGIMCGKRKEKEKRRGDWLGDFCYLMFETTGRANGPKITLSEDAGRSLEGE